MLGEEKLEFGIGKRIQVNEQTATIRYYGEVYGAEGVWIGVEWDDPSKGKHSGVHNGRSYFTCR